MKIKTNTITSPRGFLASGVACGLKKQDELDLALIVSECEAAAAGVFTRNVVKGHSLQRTMKVIVSGKARAIVINSGNANACVGSEGDDDARSMAAAVAEKIGCSPTEVLTGSTGVIGKRLDMNALRIGIDHACAELDNSPQAGNRAERAIMTTDRIPKETATCFEYDGRTVTVAGIAKGSGMIHPNMATMIGLITTDLAIEQALLQQLLRRISDKTFNRVSVDGDTSVCDMVLALANGMSQTRPIVDANSPAAMQFCQALETVCSQLARMIAIDGEGATKLIEIRCEGARSAQDAFQIVQSIGRSPLVKTAMFGEDANWGRILTAAGYSGADFNPAGCDIWLGDLMVCHKGVALLFDENKAKRILQEREILIRVTLSDGSAADRLWTCDFSYDYVRINGSYRT